MKKTKKKPLEVALITGNPADQVVINPEDPPKKFQTEAIKLLKTKLKAPEFKYLAPTDRVEVDTQNMDKQVKHIKKIVTKISTQPVTEEELNTIVSEAGRVGAVLSSPIRAAGLAGKAAYELGRAAVFSSTPQSAALFASLGLQNISQRMSDFGKYTPKQKQSSASQTSKPVKTQAPKQPGKKTNPDLQNLPMPPKLPLKDEPAVEIPQATAAPSSKPRETIVMGKKYTEPETTTQPQSTRPQGGGRQKGQLSQSPSAVRRREQRAQARAAGRTTGTVVSHREWDYDTYIIEKLESSLVKKSERSGIDAEVLSDVFLRGMDSWNEQVNVSQHQYAMQRVNSFIAKGRNYYNEDKDLQEKSVVMGGKRYQQVGVGPREIVKRKLSKMFGKNTLLKRMYTPTQQVKVALQRLKRKYKQAAALKHKKGLGEQVDNYTVIANGKEIAVNDATHAENKARKMLSHKEADIVHVAKNGKKIYSWKLGEKKQPVEEGSGLWANIHAKRARIKAGSGEKMRKPGSEGAPTKQNFIDAQEAAMTPMKPKGEKPFKPSMSRPKGEWDPIHGKAPRKGTLKYDMWKRNVAQDKGISESFVVDRAAGYSTTYTAADLGIKMQGGFAYHPSVMEAGGAGEEGTTKLVNKYKKDTPGEAVEALQRVIRNRRKANTQC